MVSIHLKHEGGWRKVSVDGRRILVISDGAGTERNRAVYEELVSQGYEMDFVRAGSRSFEYPTDWQHGNPASCDSHGFPTHDLAGFGHEVGDRLRVRPPSLIICGSRGSQVTLGVILKHHWRGPFIAMNAGPMTSRTDLPRDCFACFVTFGKDYFSTKDPTFTNAAFQDLASTEERGILVHLPKEAHMPRASALSQVLGRIIKVGQERSTSQEVQSIFWPEQQMTIFELTQGHAPKILWEW